MKVQFTVILTALILTGCASAPPEEPENLCRIFEEKRDWYDAASDMRDKWGVPIQVPMAMMYQESSFKHDAVPPRDYILWIIPWGRVSSAYGYSQAKTATWDDYVRETGNSWSSRDDFEDAIDFMGWFISKSQTINGVSKWDAYAQYLNYHEGWGGYQRQTYRQKRWLMRTAERVKARASRYGAQLRQCEDELKRGWLWRLLF
ncbi:transglycosylase SLT domain-containing protein [Pseudidiomarina andamanensis]|uniref:Transglycosylase SLT domain-containing protein n=1 Tax=Pseudidiomarina andamanensis TaxID=1940690 RepID=A0AA92ES00_9GAMM|nr:hypothetical protein [Pseudidiomarina andamanensis]MDS0218711.1 hypothetical protein [Pseudidiomarina andamanensis]QGT95572.1 hypothetical protein D3795_04990 [Pseudidiomarina andamanensis]